MKKKCLIVKIFKKIEFFFIQNGKFYIDFTDFFSCVSETSLNFCEFHGTLSKVQLRCWSGLVGGLVDGLMDWGRLVNWWFGGWVNEWMGWMDR